MTYSISGGLVVSALVSGSSGLGSSTGGDIALYSRARHFALRVPLSTQIMSSINE